MAPEAEVNGRYCRALVGAWRARAGPHRSRRPRRFVFPHGRALTAARAALPLVTARRTVCDLSCRGHPASQLGPCSIRVLTAVFCPIAAPGSHWTHTPTAHCKLPRANLRSVDSRVTLAAGRVVCEPYQACRRALAVAVRAARATSADGQSIPT